jgi:hypothetical protein
MKITLESTTQVVTLATQDHPNAVILCRVWEGQTEGGIKVHCLIPRIAAKNDQDLAQFEAELYRAARAVFGKHGGVPLADDLVMRGMKGRPPKLVMCPYCRMWFARYLFDRWHRRHCSVLPLLEWAGL